MPLSGLHCPGFPTPKGVDGHPDSSGNCLLGKRGGHDLSPLQTNFSDSVHDCQGRQVMPQVASSNQWLFSYPWNKLGVVMNSKLVQINLLRRRDKWSFEPSWTLTSRTPAG